MLDIASETESESTNFVTNLAGTFRAGKAVDGKKRLADTFHALQAFFRRFAKIPPAIYAQLIVISELAGVTTSGSVNARRMNVDGREFFEGVSPSSLMRMGIFLCRDHPGRTASRVNLAKDVMSVAIRTAALRELPVDTRVYQRVQELDDALAFIPVAVAIEKTGQVPPGVSVAHRWFTPYAPVEVIEEGSGAEYIGYVIDPVSGDATEVERDRLAAELRGSKHKTRWNNEPVCTVRIPGATATPFGLILFGEDKILPLEFANQPNVTGSDVDYRLLGEHLELIVANDRLALLRSFDVQDTGDAVLLSGQSNQYSYGHFILNGISKAGMIAPYIAAGEKVIVPTQRKGFHDSIIRYLGFDPDQFIFTERITGYRSSNLRVIAEAPLGMWQYNALRTLREFMPRPPDTGGKKRIFVDRPPGARRPLQNHQAILDLLAKYDIEVVHPELLPFDEQVAIFESADVIVAPHGSALITLVFCLKPKRIVELQNKTTYRQCLYNFLGHQAVRVPSTLAPGFHGRMPDESEFITDIDVLEHAIRWATAS